MCSLQTLPPEVLIEIFLNLPVNDCLKLSKSCKTMTEIANIDLLWEKKIQLDFGIKVNPKSSNDSKITSFPKKFYRYVLHRYGRLLGSWQLATFGHYGGLYQVIFNNTFVDVLWCEIYEVAIFFYFSLYSMIGVLN